MKAALRKQLIEHSSRVRMENAAKRAVEFAFAESNIAKLSKEQRASFARTVANTLLEEMKTGDEARPKPPENWVECVWCDGRGYVAPECGQCGADLTDENVAMPFGEEGDDLCRPCAQAEGSPWRKR